jgi:hypothetical protein
MGNKFASGKNAIGECDICGFRYKLSELKVVVVNMIPTNTLACCTCWDIDHPQWQLGRWPVEDPQAIRNPRPDFSGYYENGNNGAGGSRMDQWGWNPVGGGPAMYANNTGLELLFPNALVGQMFVNSVTITVT